jgi:sulfur relay (sulfurtransferase) DsrF/TusC family protein
MAEVAVILRSGAFNNRRSAEALRMSVGQTLAENHVRLIFAGDAVYLLGKSAPGLIGGGDIRLPLETLRMLGHPVYAEAESLEERGFGALPDGVQKVSRADVARMLAECHVVIAW